MKMKSPEGPTIQPNIEKRKDASINKRDTQVKPLERPNEEAETDKESEFSDDFFSNFGTYI